MNIRSEDISKDFCNKFQKIKNDVENVYLIGIRTYILDHPFKLQQALYSIDYNPALYLSKEKNFCKVYSSNGIQFYLYPKENILEQGR